MWPIKTDKSTGCRSLHRNSTPKVVSTPEKPTKSHTKGLTSETSLKNACKTGKSKLASVQKSSQKQHTKSSQYT